ncbi:pancreatic triacylglycerol lipase-like isoform X2 [Paramacrobiotus metropolitanus]|uniref:pancreatic triacylglycerol lipase-like isoform X2 n=1 Tax=Paramacrobiotus metropolitanus TaxID=2943436 RepID=UPI002445F6F8|nr:pancreatic triacylglycerol lipase-like isoform X2 [Paramacrobiotus metropolitanus]
MARSGLRLCTIGIVVHILISCLCIQNARAGFFSFISEMAQSGNKNSKAPSSPTSGNANSEMTVQDAGDDDSDPKANPTEPRGDDFPKMVAGAIKSVMEYEAVKKDAANDKRPTSVFYEGLGWFYRNGTLSNLNKLPMDPKQMGTKFLLYTQQNQLQPEQLDYTNPATIQQCSFRAGLPTVVITHGFKTSKGQAGLQWVMLFVDALFRRLGQGNYIVVDWSNGAQAPDYWFAAANTQLVGAQLAKIIELLSQIKQAPLSQFSLMGFSLGSHASGFAGKRLAHLGKVQRIFGIDPAGPMFEKADPGGRLSKGDAVLVVAEHGSADGLKNGGLGIWQQIGDVDFYANGGKEQPGCGNMVSATVNQLLHLNFKGIPEAMRCNHDRNWMYILQSFDPQCQYMATPCDIFNHISNGQCSAKANDPDQPMGFFATNQPSARPMFFSTVDGAVRQTSCQNHVKISIQSVKQSRATRGNFIISFIDDKGAESTPFVIAQDGRVPSGKQAFLLVRSAVPPSSIKQIKVTFQRLCNSNVCNADTINLSAVTVANVNNDVVMTYCGGGDLVSDQPKLMDLRSSKSSSCGRNGWPPAIFVTNFLRVLLS